MFRRVSVALLAVAIAFGTAVTASPAQAATTAFRTYIPQRTSPSSIKALSNGASLVLNDGGRMQSLSKRITKLTPSGALDTSFETNGTAIAFTDGSKSVGNVVVLSDGKIETFATMQSGRTGIGYLFNRYLPNGARDTGFGSNGTKVWEDRVTYYPSTYFADGVNGDVFATGAGDFDKNRP